MKLIKFKDLDNFETHGGILLDNGDVVCGCCGGLLTADEEYDTWEPIEVIDWESIDDIIMDMF